MRDTLRRTLAAAALLACTCFTVPGAVRADAPRDLNLQYHDGRLIQKAKVVTLFWGSYWSTAPGEVSYFNSFFKALFADGRYLRNLEQYSTSRYHIGNGYLAWSTTDPARLPATVTDDEILSEIRSGIQSGGLPAPDADTIYFVFTPPNVLVDDGSGDSANDFLGYHSADADDQNRPFAYALIASYSWPSGKKVNGSSLKRDVMTETSSHELAEAITDPLTDDPKSGWWDETYGPYEEIGDIVDDFYSNIDDVLVAPDGTRYVVEKMWSEKDQKPVAFAR